jgi:hypothetical protein
MPGGGRAQCGCTCPGDARQRTGAVAPWASGALVSKDARARACRRTRASMAEADRLIGLAARAAPAREGKHRDAHGPAIGEGGQRAPRFEAVGAREAPKCAQPSGQPTALAFGAAGGQQRCRVSGPTASLLAPLGPQRRERSKAADPTRPPSDAPGWCGNESRQKRGDARGRPRPRPHPFASRSRALHSFPSRREAATATTGRFHRRSKDFPTNPSLQCCRFLGSATMSEAQKQPCFLDGAPAR